VPPLGGLVGAVLGPFIYQMAVGNHLAETDADITEAASQDAIVHLTGIKPSTTNSTQSIDTVSTHVP